MKVWGIPGPKQMEMNTGEHDSSYQKFKNNYRKPAKMHRAPEDRFGRTQRGGHPPMGEVWGITVYLSQVPKINVLIRKTDV